MQIFKKITAIILSLTMVFSLTSCSVINGMAGSNSSSIPKPKLPDTAITYDEIGVAIELPKTMEEHMGSLIFPVAFIHPDTKDIVVNGLIALEYQSNVVFQRMEELNSRGQSVSSAENNELKKQIRSLMYVFSFTTESVNAYLNSGKDLKDFTDFTHNDFVTEIGSNSIYVGYNDADTAYLNEEDTALYLEFMKFITTKAYTISTYTPVKAARSISVGMSIDNIDAKDFDGNSFKKENFVDYDLTVINVWATTCPPCVQEMPDLEKLSKDYKGKGVQIMGICSDTDGKRNFKEAKKIVEKTGVTYKNLVVGDYLRNNVITAISATPTTILVDSKGKIVAKAIVGAKSYDEFKAIIDAQLGKIKNPA